MTITQQTFTVSKSKRETLGKDVQYAEHDEHISHIF